MITEAECEKFAREVLQNYVNKCKPNSVADVSLAIQKMIAVSISGLDAVENGAAEIIQ